MLNSKRVIDLKKLINNRRGSVLALSLLVFLFLGGMLAAVSPMIINEVKMNAVNRDMVDAQFAAEAGAKIGIAAIYAKKTNSELTWLGTAQALTTSEADKTYTVTISPAVSSSGPETGTAYTVKSVGTVRGTSKGISVVVTLSSNAAGVYSYAAYSAEKMNLEGHPVIAGAGIASDGKIKIDNGITVGDIFYTGPAPNYQKKEVTTGTVTKVSSVGTLDVASLMKYTPTMPAMPAMPAMPTFTMPSISLLPQSQSTTALTGAYNYSSNPNSGTYYTNNDFYDWSYSYTVAPDQSVLIYVKGNLTLGQSISGGGKVTIYATGNIVVQNDITGSDVNIYAGNDITVYNKISGSNITLQSGGSFTLNGGSILTGTIGSVKIYSGGSQNIGSGSGSITGNSVTLQSGGSSTLNGASILTGTTGTLKVYSGGLLTFYGSAPITGSDIAFQSAGNLLVNNSGTISAGTTGTVKINSGGTLTLNGGGTIIGSNITLQSVGAVSISAENILADSASGIINIYSGGSFDYTGNSIIRGGIVTITTGKTSGTAVNLHGGYINNDRPTYITKIYSYGNAGLTSTVLGGISMVVATGTLTNNGMTSSAILIAQGNITSESGSSAGLYTNGSITTSGSTITYSNNAANAVTLGLTSGAGGTDISITDWKKAAI